MDGADTTHGWTLLFLETIGRVESQIQRKMCLQNQFFDFKSGGMGFSRKNVKEVFGAPLPTERVIFIFVIQRSRSLKNGHVP